MIGIISARASARSRGERVYPAWHATMRCGVFLIFILLALKANADLSPQWTTTIQSPPWQPNFRMPSAVRALVHGSNMYVLESSRLYRSSNGSTWTLVASSIPNITGSDLDLVSYNGKLWGIPLLKGSAASPNRVVTSTDGKVWTPVGQGVPWISKGAYSTVVHNDQIFVVGATSDPAHPADPNIYATRDGINWRLVSSSFPGDKLAHATLASFKGKLWLINCNWTGTNYTNAVWSSPDGCTWAKANGNPGWNPREGSVAVVYDDRLWMIGGCTEYLVSSTEYPFESITLLNPEGDLWSSANGSAWNVEPGVVAGVNVYPAGYDEYYRRIAALAFQNKLWIFNQYGVSYSWLPPGPPRINRIGDTTLDEGTPYVIPKPVLTQGTRPVTWSLINPPSGMKIDPVTGSVTWPFPLYRGTPYRIRLRAANSAGVGETSWTLTVKALAAPVASMPLMVKGSQTTLTWTSVPKATGYMVQRDDAPDFATPQGTAIVSSATLARVMGGLANDTTSWYRVRAQLPNGMTAQWSNVTSCTQDAAPPKGWIASVDAQHGKWPLAGSIRLIVAMTDPGAKASGLKTMRFSLDRQHWTPWQPYAPAATYWAGRTGTQRVYLQVCDRVGNLLEVSTSVTIPSFKALYVDAGNTSAPWDGTIQHPFQRITDAINAAHDGDTIIAAPGRYRECINMQGKNIVLRSIDPQCLSVVQSTIIDGQRQGSTVTFKGTETTSCVLAGFTITNGLAGSLQPTETAPGEGGCHGGGIRGNHTRATLDSNYIAGNSAQYFTIFYVDISLEITTIMGYGGGLYQCDGKIINNIIAHNAVGMDARPGVVAGSPAASRRIPPDWPVQETYYNCHGSALFDCNGPILNNTLVANGAPVNDSVIEACHGLIRNNIIDNGSLVNTSTPEYCCLPGSSPFKGNHNLLGDPRLAGIAGDNFRLLPDSPCIDAGAFTDEARDLDGTPRGYDGVSQPRGDGSNCDIGALEYIPSSGAIWMLAPEEGVSLNAGDTLAVHWRTDPSQAGTTVLLELYCGEWPLAYLGESSSVSGDGRCTVRLPRNAGGHCSIRAISKMNQTLFAQSPSFSVRRLNAADPRSWGLYE